MGVDFLFLLIVGQAGGSRYDLSRHSRYRRVIVVAVTLPLPRNSGASRVNLGTDRSSSVVTNLAGMIIRARARQFTATVFPREIYKSLSVKSAAPVLDSSLPPPRHHLVVHAPTQPLPSHYPAPDRPSLPADQQARADVLTEALLAPIHWILCIRNMRGKQRHLSYDFTSKRLFLPLIRRRFSPHFYTHDSAQ
jgi:hypothetical protein